MGTERPDGGYSAEAKAWLELQVWGRPIVVPLARTNAHEFRTTEAYYIAEEEAILVVSIDGVEHRRRIRITGGVAWEYEEITEDRKDEP